MSGVLARLVGRAKGEPAGRLRPRLPQRFETPAAAAGDGRDTGFATATEGFPAAERTFSPASNGGQHPGPQHSQSRDLPPRGPSRPVTPPRVERDPSQSGRPRPALDAGPVPPTSGAVYRPPPVETMTEPPFLPATTGSTPVRGRQGNATKWPAALHAPPVPGPQSMLVQPNREAPPVPLMPVAPRPSLPAEPGPQSAASPIRIKPAPATSAAAGPDIVIHIGRIELKAATEAAPRPRPRPARQSMTDLGDYLKGRGGEQ